ncbi:MULTISPECIES: helix-turn-helix domain-containing protein [unclassified Nocardioides]|uniref:helix-turn-helix domain-containing protein n=1 Tax=unclassified Nocardioides TaxID=2615069 RepID=UPI0011538820|nr:MULTISPECIES: helix-turn-helix transcriptional regulator [unclassified Nocardioides]TQK71232.1 hypothetical protein FBY23_3021 [Nocardioides sp. SLBN-35]WGY04601.1 helix-turn-helix transcriptional regulator [Nocardioides sp. QY071]
MMRNPAVLTDLPTPVLLEETVLALRAREAELSARCPEASERWRRWEEEHGGTGTAAFCAVLAGFLALAVLDDPVDLARAAALTQALGEERVAQRLQRAARLVDLDPDLPLTTVVVHRLLAEETTAGVGRALLFQDLDVQVAPEDRVTVRAARADLVAFGRGGSVAAGRRGLGMLAASPWGPAAEELVEEADDADLEVVATLLGWCRSWRTDRDRVLVGRQVQRLVAVSGVSQRRFAARIGTSPSRLSSYVGGSVTPSATMLLRIQRSARAFQAELSGAAGSSANVASPVRA